MPFKFPIPAVVPPREVEAAVADLERQRHAGAVVHEHPRVRDVVGPAVGKVDLTEGARGAVTLWQALQPARDGGPHARGAHGEIAVDHDGRAERAVTRGRVTVGGAALGAAMRIEALKADPP